MAETKEYVEELYRPELFYDSISGAMFASSFDWFKRRQKAIEAMCTSVEKSWKDYKFRVEREFTTNNRLKMHGKPMRRKGS